MSDTAKLVLVDGSSFIYRAYFAARGGFSTSKGIPTGAVLIITRMFEGLLRDYPNTPILMVFDAGGKTFRNDLYPEYKANRPPMPDDLQVQIPYVHRLVEAMGFQDVSMKGFEADDIIGSYTKAAKKAGMSVVICSGDKDLAQLAGKGVIIHDYLKNEILDSQGVFKKYGVKPEHIIDFLALKGDSSDNIPGMPGTGDKTACAIINALGGIADIKKRIDEAASLKFRGAATFKERFEEYLPQIELSYNLALIKTDLALPIALDSLTVPLKNREQLLSLYKELEFNKFYEAELLRKGQDESLSDKESSKSGEDNGSAACSTPVKTIVITQKSELKALADRLGQEDCFAFCCLTSEFESNKGKLVGIAFVTNLQSWYLPLAHDYIVAPQQLTISDTVEILGPVFAGEHPKKICHDLKAALIALHKAGLPLKGIYADTKIMAHLIDSQQGTELEKLSYGYLNYEAVPAEKIVGKGTNRIPFSSASVDTAGAFAVEQANLALRLCSPLEKQLEQIPGGFEILRNIEIPFAQALARMQGNGAFLNVRTLRDQNALLNREAAAAAESIYIAAGEKFNLQSPKQLGRILFEKLKISYPQKPGLNKDGTYSYSTAEAVLQEIAPVCDIARLVLRFRLLMKLISTYTEKLPDMVLDGRIYTNFNQTGTNTGRLSSTDPNLQNIPARSEEGRNIRRAFAAPKGYKIVSADYSQIELRLIAHFSEDPNLIKAFINGEDIHRHTAAQVLNKEIQEVTAQERSSAKAVNFGLMYGISAHGLARQTGMTFKQAQNYITAYFKRYPAVQSYMQRVKDFAKEHGYVQTIAGRRICFGRVQGLGRVQLAAVERQAVNAPMQGSAADIIKQAMIDIDNWINTLDESLVRPTLQVHDELVFEVKEEFLEEACLKIQDIMKSAWVLKVPLEVGIGFADNWADAH